MAKGTAHSFDFIEGPGTVGGYFNEQELAD